MFCPDVREKCQPNCAGTASDQTRETGTPSGARRPKSWHGAQVCVFQYCNYKVVFFWQVPGKPKLNNAFMSEMQTKLSRRRDKVLLYYFVL